MTTAANPFGATINNAFVIAVHKVDAVANGTFFSLTGSDANRWQSHAPWGDGKLYFDCGGTGSPNRLSATYGISAGNTVLSSFYSSTANNVQQVHRNGTLLVGDSSGHAVNTGGNISVGGINTVYQDTTLGEFIIINGTVDLATREKLEGYLAHKWGLAANLPAAHPFKNAAPTQGSTPTATATLAGSASDADGGSLTTTWSVISSPAQATVAFANASALNTTATFDQLGTYVLRLTVSDSMDSVYDEMTVTVTDASSGLDAFADWAAIGGGGEEITFTGDANGDGVADGMSWLLGADDPTQDANGMLPQTAETNGDLVVSFRLLNSSRRGTAVLRLQHSRNLGVDDPWTENTIPVPDASGTVGGVVFEVTPIPATDHNQVQAILPATAAAGTGKLFVRLSGAPSP